MVSRRWNCFFEAGCIDKTLKNSCTKDPCTGSTLSWPFGIPTAASYLKLTPRALNQNQKKPFVEIILKTFASET